MVGAAASSSPPGVCSLAPLPTQRHRTHGHAVFHSSSLCLSLSLSLSLSTTSCLCVRVRVRACAHANVPLRIWRGGRSEYKRNRTSEREIVKHGFGGRLLEQLVQFDHLLCAPKVVACRQGGVSSVFPSDSASTLMGHDMKCMNDIIYSAPLLSSPLLFCPPSFSKSPLQGTQTRTQ